MAFESEFFCSPEENFGLKEIHRRVFREIFMAPTVVLPIIGGASAWLLSWAADGVPALTLAGLMGVLGGLGWMATRAIFRTEEITAKTIEKLQQQELAAEQAELDRLEDLLKQDDDDRDQELLKLLRIQRAQFQEIASQPGFVVRSQDVLLKVDQLFKASINNLYESYRLWLQSRELSKSQRKLLLDERERLLDDIQQTVNSLQQSLDQYRGLAKRAVGSDLGGLREELEASIDIAKRTEERLRQLDSNPDYPSYLREVN